ncbi:MAG: PAS domain S-box protein, partial [Nitrospinota bacterium]
MTAKTQYNSLSARLIVSILLIIFVPSFIGLAILGMKTRDDFRRQTITHLRDGLEIKSVTATDKLHLTITSLRLATKRVKMELDASEGLALRLSLGEAPKEWYDDKLYRKLYTLLKNEISKHSGITEAKIINSSGNELIRLVLTPSGIEEKAPGELENKAHRKYFKNMMSLPGGRIKINPVSLQREHKQIVRPYMPVLRIGGKITLTVPLRRSLTPKASATGASGTMAAQADEINFGIVIFNIKSEYIFGMRTSRKGSGFMVTDEKGYYLVHPEENALWGDELGTSANLFKDEPEIRENSSLKNAILNRDKGIQYNQIHDDYNVWRKIRYDELNPSRYWLLFQKGRKDSIEAQWEQVVKNGFAWFALIILLGFVVLALVVTKALRPLTEVADAMKRLEDGDLSARAVAKSRTEIGKITHAFNSMADWLEKYRSELQKSLAISCAMSDTAPNAHIVIKQDGKILSANRAAERIFDYSVDELSGKDIKILMPKPYNEKEEDYVWDDLGMGIDRIVGFGMKELNAMRNGGEVFRVSVYLGKAKIANEAVLLAVISDISERKRTVAALLENEQKYRNLFTNANDAIYLIDPVTAKIIDCNRKAAEITGYDMDKLKTMTVLDLLPEENRNLIPRLFQEVMDKGAVTDISDLHHKKKDGSLVPIEINASIIEIGG